MASPIRLPPEGVAKVDIRRQVSWLAGPCFSSTFPEQPCAPVADRVKLAAYSCGGSRGFGQSPHHVPFFVPPGGSRRLRDYIRRGIDRKRNGASALTKRRWRPLSGCDQRSLTRERTGNAVRNVRFQCRSCPRNCKRRARTTLPLGTTREGGDGRRPASQETCR